MIELATCVAGRREAMSSRAGRLGLGILLGIIPGVLMLALLALFVPDAIIEWAVAIFLIVVGAIVGGVLGWRGRRHSTPGHLV
jgi:uncharacterized membrane protein YfcA